MTLGLATMDSTGTGASPPSIFCWIGGAERAHAGLGNTPLTAACLLALRCGRTASAVTPPGGFPPVRALSRNCPLELASCFKVVHAFLAQLATAAPSPSGGSGCSSVVTQFGRDAMGGRRALAILRHSHFQALTCSPGPRLFWPSLSTAANDTLPRTFEVRGVSHPAAEDPEACRAELARTVGRARTQGGRLLGIRFRVFRMRLVVGSHPDWKKYLP
jgi:hypothetical protein